MDSIFLIFPMLLNWLLVVCCWTGMMGKFKAMSCH